MLSVYANAVPTLPPGLISARSSCVICPFPSIDLSITAYELIGDMSSNLLILLILVYTRLVLYFIINRGRTFSIWVFPYGVLSMEKILSMQHFRKSQISTPRFYPVTVIFQIQQQRSKGQAVGYQVLRAPAHKS